MEEQRGFSTGVASVSGLSGEKRNLNGSEERDESGSKRVKLQDVLDSDAKSSNLQSVGNIGIVQKPNLSNEQMTQMLVAKDIKQSTVFEAKSMSTNDDSNCEPRGVHVDEVLKNSSHLNPKEEISKSVESPHGRDHLLSVPVSEKVSPFQICSTTGSLGESDSMRRWMEMKRNGFVSGPLGGVAAPSSVVSSTPSVEVSAQKQQKVNKRRSESLKKRNEIPKKEQQVQADRFSNIAAPSGLLTELNPGIINHIRTKKQVFSIIESLIRNTNYDATEGEKQANFNVRESVGEDRALAFKVSDNVNSNTNPEQVTSLAVEAATVASQWLEFLHQDLSGRLSAVQDSRNRVQSILNTELPLLISSSNKESTLEMTNMNTSGGGDAMETHQIRWSAKFDQINKALYDEERDLERSLNQVKEMQSRCNDGLRQMDEYSPFSSQSSDSSFGKDGNHEISMAVQAAAASIFSTCSFLLSMMKPPPTTGL